MSWLSQLLNLEPLYVVQVYLARALSPPGVFPHNLDCIFFIGILVGYLAASLTGCTCLHLTQPCWPCCWSSAKQPRSCDCVTMALSSSADCQKMPVLRIVRAATQTKSLFFFLKCKGYLDPVTGVGVLHKSFFSISLSAETPMSHSRGTF